MAYQVPLVFIKLSDDLAICATRIVAMLDMRTNQAINIRRSENKAKTLINGCGRKTAKSLIILDNGAVVSSPLSIGILCRTLMTSNAKRVVRPSSTPRVNKETSKTITEEDLDFLSSREQTLDTVLIEAAEE